MDKAKKGRGNRRANGARENESFPLYTVPELCRLLKVKPDTLRKWRVAGTGPPFIQNTRFSVVYLRSSVAKWLKQVERTTQVSYRRKTRADQSAAGS